MGTAGKAAGVAIAVAAASVFAMASVPGAYAQGAKVECYGANSCKGLSDCKTAKSECKGLNSCKGLGFKVMSDKECTAAHGKPMKMKS